jgi:2-keto-4-pentenoate hydratase/2-oxohepta-3-ene-1,7-dioic acid hydratase in catechol pathway
MRLLSHAHGFGRLHDDDPELFVPMGRDLVAYLAGEEDPAVDGAPIPVESLQLSAPVPRPGKIICVGLNYRDHAEETGKPIPEEPVLFGKFANSVVAHGADVPIPEAAREVDWEAELGVVIGRRARNVSASDALAYVAGYTCVNDLSARDLQRRGGQWTRGKAIDGFLPMGPHLVTADEVTNPQDLRITCSVNGGLVQDSNTAEMVFGVAELISIVSQTITLEPGDCMATGTPPGVGMAMSPPRFLRPGDVVVVEIEGIGRLETRMV